MTVALTNTQQDDLEWVMALEADPEIARWVTVWPAERHRLAISAPDEAHLTVSFAGELVGFVLLAGLSGLHDAIELRRIVIARPGQGLGRVTLEATLEHAFEHCEAHRVWLDVMLDNERARRLYESIGFLAEGIMRDAHRDGDRYLPLCLMSILAPEWRERRRSTRSGPSAGVRGGSSASRRPPSAGRPAD
ncbi:MAG TPA: GNAT family protein [Solirubrobacteraceae bacterium]|nr:GNAT family protein [Solirubrobacteraceae bacterium]